MAIAKGNILNFSYDNPVSNTIKTVMGHYWSHTGIVVKVEGDHVHILEAMGTYREEKYVPRGFFSKFKFLWNLNQLFGGKVSVNVYSKIQLTRLLTQNKLKIMDFKLDSESTAFEGLVKYYENAPYDYFGAFRIGIKRVLKFFGRTYSSDKETLKSLFCSELGARFIIALSDIDFMKMVNKETPEDVAPQDISLVYDRLRYSGKL